ncbi:hypothetical protein KDW55_05010 [Burkholderia sp. AU19243]|uniref:hypothetical protein n=1 Tax=Burkholderia TaxID=32008 RepID=UPI00142D1FF0|nr:MULTISPECIES: hypothetical protein [Burkholderia]MBR8362681.1 hypothetical protein [Burkholderia sp. AU19243]MCA8307844.1 hypothetical protein [Burkholderia sp. AU28942]QTO50852.1 hypothetical protein J8I86_25400 [Burkholderia latens]
MVLLSDAFIFVRIPYRILNALMPDRIASAMPAAGPGVAPGSTAVAASIPPAGHSTFTQVKTSTSGV